MSIRTWAASFRTRILLIVFIVTVLPLGLVGLWLNAAAARSGEGLIRESLETAVGQVAVGAGTQWLAHRSTLLDLAETEVIRLALVSAAASPSAADRASPPDRVTEVLDASPAPLGMVRINDVQGRLIWEYASDASAALSPDPTLAVSVNVYESALGPTLGTLTSELAVRVLVPDNTPTPGGIGTVLGVYEAGSGAPLIPLPVSLENETGADIDVEGERWFLARRELTEPRLTLIAAAPLSPFTTPYLSAARRGALVLTAVGVLGLLLTGALTSRMATSLERLAEAADAVSGGDLERSVDARGGDEVGRVARAFNQMTEGLRSSLRELADSRALAAVGEFAAQLAHEVRNPLSAVRMDLQMVEEGLPEGSRLREIQERVLSEVERLDVTVSGALRTARSGRTPRQVIDLRDPLLAAVAAAGTTGGPRNVEVVCEAGGVDAPVTGDAAALEQVFLNLLLNALEASDDGGRVRVSLSSTDSEVEVEVRDRGSGIAEEDIASVYEPLYSTRPDGSGLGLTIARRLVIAHGGHLEIESEVDRGTVVRVRLPATSEESPSGQVAGPDADVAVPEFSSRFDT